MVGPTNAEVKIAFLHEVVRIHKTFFCLLTMLSALMPFFLNPTLVYTGLEVYLAAHIIPCLVFVYVQDIFFPFKYEVSASILLISWILIVDVVYYTTQAASPLLGIAWVFWFIFQNLLRTPILRYLKWKTATTP